MIHRFAYIAGMIDEKVAELREDAAREDSSGNGSGNKKHTTYMNDDD